MSCMEHSCADCNRHWFNDLAREACPRCASHNVTHYWDEQEDAHDMDYDAFDSYGDYCDD